MDVHLNWERRALLREPVKTPMVTLEELQRSTTQMEESVNKNSSGALLTSGLHEETIVGEKAIRSPVCSFCMPCRGHSKQNRGRRSGQMRPILTFLAFIHKV
ncbi:hypothetical protein ILYODFUR_007908 [Ilyodon furcidens]|uniref:Uncharacterized protein n=1 Tax=Ilyodon furcidens TaxID=33524 RepID=A0ABV0T665_9TELE